MNSESKLELSAILRVSKLVFSRIELEVEECYQKLDHSGSNFVEKNWNFSMTLCKIFSKYHKPKCSGHKPDFL